jgi:cephalosporin-C deacetylase-like acetyl esterase
MLGRIRGWRPDYTEGLAYYDGANMAKRIRRETAVSIGLGDYTCPPSGVAVVYNHIMAPKRIAYTQGATHGYTPPNPAKQVVSHPAPQARVAE